MICRSQCNWRVRATLCATAAFYLAASTATAKPGKPKNAAPVAPSPPAEAGARDRDRDRNREEVAGKTIAVTVVEVAGTQAYLQPGAQGGVRRGAKITLNHQEYTVVQATDSFAAIVVGENPPREQDKGQATPLGEQATEVRALEKPKPLSTWTHAWREAEPPASSQKPRFVPLGSVERDRLWDVRLSASSGALLPLGPRGGNLVRAEIDARIHAQPFDAPAALDLDAALQHFFDPTLTKREGSPARPTLYVRELLASYGSGGYYGGIGRMRYAASTLGTLDGARASAPLGEGFSIGAFGGLLPDPLSGAPSVGANRFGVEATYSRPDAELRPDAALVLQGSTFGGKLDERRLSGVASVYPGPSRLGAHFQVSSFDSSNPWKAKAFELTAAGVDSSIRAGVFQLEGRFDVRQPERSRWLASYLPAAWFCTTVPSPAGAPPGPERCDGGVSTLAIGTVDAGVEFGTVSLFVGGTRTGDLTQSGGPSALGVFATGRVVRIADFLRVDASGNYSKATYLDMFGGSAGPGLTLFGDALDLSVYYRATALRYRSVPASLLQHAAGGTVIVVPDSAILLAVQGEAITGDDAKALVLFGTVTWRPPL